MACPGEAGGGRGGCSGGAQASAAGFGRRERPQSAIPSVTEAVLGGSERCRVRRASADARCGVESRRARAARFQASGNFYRATRGRPWTYALPLTDTRTAWQLVHNAYSSLSLGTADPVWLAVPFARCRAVPDRALLLKAPRPRSPVRTPVAPSEHPELVADLSRLSSPAAGAARPRSRRLGPSAPSLHRKRPPRPPHRRPQQQQHHRQQRRNTLPRWPASSTRSRP